MDKVFAIMWDKNPRILISSFELPVPPIWKGERTKYFDIAETILCEERVNTILNVANDVVDKPLHHEMYKKLNIDYWKVGIDDTKILPPKLFDFLQRVIGIYDEHIGKNGIQSTILINCQAGVNRSALAIGAILWSRIRKTIPQESTWKNAEDLIDYMRYIQKRDRELDILLSNDVFKNYLMNWCPK